MRNIEIYDNFFDDDVSKSIFEYCKTVNYKFGEYDKFSIYPDGFVYDISKVENVYKLIFNKIEEKFKVSSYLEIYRMNINTFPTTYHSDHKCGYTFLYYVGDFFDMTNEGETQFLFENFIYGVSPIPNRMVRYPSNIRHKATKFVEGNRFTLASKYKCK